jgi:hypothetical protein
MLVTAIAVLAAPPVDPVTHPGGPPHSLASTPDLPSPDAQPGTIPGAAEPEEDQEPPADAGVPTRRLDAPTRRPAGLARHLVHAPFAAPRAVPLRV